jgi:hypothetical protein
VLKLIKSKHLILSFPTRREQLTDAPMGSYKC